MAPRPQHVSSLAALFKPARSAHKCYSQLTKAMVRASAAATYPDSRSLRPQAQNPSLRFQRSYASNLKPLPEFDLSNKTILVTGGARGLGLCMAQALLEAGATVYALDRLPENEKSPDFASIQEQAKRDHGTNLHYRQIDVRDVDALNDTVRAIADETGRMDGLIAAAGIQQETPAIDYTRDDANRMFEVSRQRFHHQQWCWQMVLTIIVR